MTSLQPLIRPGHATRTGTGSTVAVRAPALTLDGHSREGVERKQSRHGQHRRCPGRVERRKALDDIEVSYPPCPVLQVRSDLLFLRGVLCRLAGDRQIEKEDAFLVGGGVDLLGPGIHLVASEIAIPDDPPGAGDQEFDGMDEDDGQIGLC